MPGQWEHSTRGQRLPPDWHARRAATYRRAHGRCQWVTDGEQCTVMAPLHKTTTQPAGHADHIERDQGDSAANLQWLCTPHHLGKSSREGNDAQRDRRRRPEQHPGLV